MTKKTYFIIAAASAIIILSGLFLVSIRQGTPQEITLIQHTDEKLALRGSTVAQNIMTEQKAISKDSNKVPLAIGGPAPAAQGCNLYTEMTFKQTGTSRIYNVSVSSIGTETCVNVSYSIYYPDSEHYSVASPKPSASDYYWVLGTMRPDEVRTTTITTTVDGIEGAAEMCATANNTQADACVTATPASSSTPNAPVVSTEPIKSVTQKAAPAQSSGSFNILPGKEYGIWVWDSPLSMSNQKMDTIVAQTRAAGMNVIYLTVDDVLIKDRAQFTKALATFVQKANAQGIAVDAVAGARDWAKPANRSKGYAVIDFVKTYNKTNPKIRSFQYDVEPYLLPEYEGNKAPVLTDFVAFIDASALRLAGSDVRFSVVIPHFYDSTQAWTPKITFNGKSDYTFNHISRSLDRNPGSTIIIMAYRDHFEDEDGTRELVTPEIQQAGTTKVIVAQETGNVEPAYVTFYGQSRRELFSSLGSIQNAFKNNVGFGGVAVHYFDPFIALQ